MTTPRSPFALALSLLTAVATTGPARAEYASQGIDEAQGLKQVITDTKAPISPEVMAAVVAKVKANPGLTNALIQANPRFKKILGISDNAPAAPVAPPVPVSAAVPNMPPVAYTPVAKRAPSIEATRLAVTLSQVNSILNGDSTTVIASRPATGNSQVGEQDNIPDTNRFGEPLAPGRRLLGKMETRRERSSETLELKRKLSLQRERKFARLSNSAGAGLQASLEFNRGVRGAARPTKPAAAAAGSGYQLAMRDISESDESASAPISSLRHRKIIGGENVRAKPVSDNEEQDLVPHKYVFSPSLIKEGDTGGGGAMGDMIRQQQSQKNAGQNGNSLTSQNGQQPHH